MSFTILALVFLAQPVNAPRSKPPLPYPHPVITEILYAVPTGDEGDADHDGRRHATGDEFVELYNPHDKPIQLKGYAITDATPAELNSDAKPSSSRPQTGPTSKPAPTKKKDEPTSLNFVFPEFELGPGEVVVVFNGLEQNIPGPCGSREHAPGTPSEEFSRAWVFSMGCKSQYVAFANKGDWVVLRDPSGTPIEAVRWGTPKHNPPAGATLVEEAPEGKGSVQRVGVSGSFVAHATVVWNPDQGPGALFSPGVFDPAVTRDAVVSTPGSSAKPTKKKPETPTPAPATTPTPSPRAKPNGGAPR